MLDYFKFLAKYFIGLYLTLTPIYLIICNCKTITDIVNINISDYTYIYMNLSILAILILILVFNCLINKFYISLFWLINILSYLLLSITFYFKVLCETSTRTDVWESFIFKINLKKKLWTQQELFDIASNYILNKNIIIEAGDLLKVISANINPENMLSQLDIILEEILKNKSIKDNNIFLNFGSFLYNNPIVTSITVVLICGIVIVVPFIVKNKFFNYSSNLTFDEFTIQDFFLPKPLGTPILEPDLTVKLAINQCLNYQHALETALRLVAKSALAQSKMLKNDAVIFSGLLESSNLKMFNEEARVDAIAATVELALIQQDLVKVCSDVGLALEFIGSKLI